MCLLGFYAIKRLDDLESCLITSMAVSILLLHQFQGLPTRSRTPWKEYNCNFLSCGRGELIHDVMGQTTSDTSLKISPLARRILQFPWICRFPGCISKSSQLLSKPVKISLYNGKETSLTCFQLQTKKRKQFCFYILAQILKAPFLRLFGLIVLFRNIDHSTMVLGWPGQFG